MISLDIHRGAVADRWRIDPCAILYELADRHPGEPAVLHLGYEDIVVFQDAEAARRIAHTNVDNYRKNLAGFRQFFGSSRLTNDGDAWRRSQRLSQPFIAGTESSLVAGAATRFFSDASQAMLLAAADATTVEVDPFLNDAAGAVIAEVTLGFGPDDLSPSLSSDFRLILQHAALTTWNVPGAPQISSPARLAEAMVAKERLRKGLDALRTKGVKRSQSELLDALLEASDIDVFAEVCTLLFAGFDTSSAALGWAMWLLAGEPDLQERLRGQLPAGTDGGDEAAMELLDSSELDAFLAESMRIFPPVPILSRIAGRDDIVAGIPIARDQKVLLSIIGLHQDANIYPNPKRISLARFPGGEMPSELRGHFMPFGTGQRGCPGSKIARVEIKMAMAVLLRRLQIRRPPDNRLSFEWLASLRRRGGQQFNLASA